MNIPNLVVYRKVDELEYWNLPDSDVTQQMLDTMTASQKRELAAAAGFEAVESPTFDRMTREELEAFAESIGFPGPYDRYATKADLITAFGGDDTEEEPTPPFAPSTPSVNDQGPATSTSDQQQEPPLDPDAGTDGGDDEDGEA